MYKKKRYSNASKKSWLAWFFAWKKVKKRKVRKSNNSLWSSLFEPLKKWSHADIEDRKRQKYRSIWG